MFRITPLVLAVTGLVALWAGLPLPASAFSSQELFARHGQKVLQVRILDRNTGLKAGFGSGFVVSASGRVATNYHVVADLVMHPDQYRAEYHNESGDSGALQLVAVDVVNDLALLQGEGPVAGSFELAERVLQKGEPVYALGNPYDLGLTIVEGTYNGLQEKSLYERIHYTGSINPGMSGGPALDADGRVVGINVATAGNQVSFLVPVEKLQRLLETKVKEGTSEEQLEAIRNQLLANQDSTFGPLLAAPFARIALGEYTLPGELAEFVHCWGDSRKREEQLYEVSYQSCSTQDEIYLSDELSSGSIMFRHELYRDRGLGTLRFYNLLEEKAQQVGFGFSGEEEDFGSFACTTRLVDGEGPNLKIVACLRGYQRFTGLYDLYLSAHTIDRDDQSLRTVLALTGASYENARAFMASYLENLSWQTPP